ncbi:MAG: tRNA 2-thiouridine(34) synthase MnmA [Proteobacteria bacterium]|nr:tRNA 2-thiouridine(34) synthase MnmA [Pseudomonadota bacterium]MBU4472235.1 tRNA 2-thiouridine(34) synthase MnmA [Pseudomonadota bacterium]MCG2750444.1 tRNA 2-thiouridine(34) synthase MnmA [Desulfobacteraceae bacterium]
MENTVAIALSGGVDSLFSALLLKHRGLPLFGIHFITGFEKTAPLNQGDSTPEGPGFEMENHPLKAMEEGLGFPIKILDIRGEFKREVVDYFVAEYAKGRTPNPCMVCNAKIKFGTLLSRANLLGATRLATGHYAKIIADDQGRFHLFRGADPIKDQSYFLSLLNQAQLSSAIFPLENLTKKDVRRMAGEQGLNPVLSSESQDICFIQECSYRDFLSLQPEFSSRAGSIVDRSGRQIGAHQGLHSYTVGQRRGINIPASEPYYVIQMIPEENILVVGHREDLLVSECRVAKINWIGEKPLSEMEAFTQVRYRHEAVPSRIIPTGEDTATVCFREPQAAVTPGQGAVFYDKNEVLGGGWIES